MATHAWALTGTVSGLAHDTQGNAIAAALATMAQGGTAPTTTSTGLTTLAGLWWHDTSANQIKVRDQADTNWIVVGSVDETGKLFTAAATGIAAIQGAAKNLKVDTRTGSVVITADEAILETTGNTYAVARSVSATISTAGSGANGLDTGSFATNTWYAVWLIYNGTTVAGLLSTSATAPTMPGGYTYKARVGWVRSNATPALLQTLQFGRRAQYVVDGTILTGMPQIAAGGVGSVSTPTYVLTAWATFAPSTAAQIDFIVAGISSTNADAIIAPNASYGNGTGSNPPHGKIWGMTNSGGSIKVPLLVESTNVYLATQNNARVYVAGWEDNL